MSELPGPAGAAGSHPETHAPAVYEDPDGAGTAPTGAGPVTGYPAVDAVLQAVADVADAPPGEQVPAFQAAHRTLRETLESIDEG